MLRRGTWQQRQLVPPEWIEPATRSSQPHNPHYGYTWWVNTAGTLWPGLPSDAFAAQGYRGNRCYIIPSLDLVVARVASGPGQWSEGAFIKRVVDAIIPN